MNPLDLFRNERQRQLDAQESRRIWAARAVHQHLDDHRMKRPRVLWTDPHTAKPLLAVVNIPRWPLPKNEPAAVRFLEIPKLQRGDAQWLRREANLRCPLTTVQPEDSCLFTVPQPPHLKILCLTPEAWADPFRRIALMADDGASRPALDTIRRALQSHTLPFRGLILTSPENLSL